MLRFIGIAPPDPLRQHIIHVQRQLADTRTRKALQPHITLIPPPQIDSRLLTDIEPAIEQAARMTEPFDVTFASLEWLSQSTLVLKVDNDGSIRTLIDALVAGSPHIQPHSRPFIPHMTILQSARQAYFSADERRSLRQRSLSLLGELPSFKTQSLTVWRHVAPRHYTRERDYPLGTRPAR